MSYSPGVPNTNEDQEHYKKHFAPKNYSVKNMEEHQMFKKNWVKI